MGLSRDGSVVTGDSMAEALRSVLDQLGDAFPPGRIDIVAGEGSDAAVTDEAYRHARQRWPRAEVVITEGGQPLYPYLVGAAPAGPVVEG